MRIPVLGRMRHALKTCSLSERRVAGKGLKGGVFAVYLISETFVQLCGLCAFALGILIKLSGKVGVLMVPVEQFDVAGQGAVQGERGQIVEVKEGGVGDVVAEPVGVSR